MILHFILFIPYYLQAFPIYAFRFTFSLPSILLFNNVGTFLYLRTYYNCINQEIHFPFGWCSLGGIYLILPNSQCSKSKCLPKIYLLIVCLWILKVSNLKTWSQSWMLSLIFLSKLKIRWCTRLLATFYRIFFSWILINHLQNRIWQAQQSFHNYKGKLAWHYYTHWYFKCSKYFLWNLIH